MRAHPGLIRCILHSFASLLALATFMLAIALLKYL